MPSSLARGLAGATVAVSLIGANPVLAAAPCASSYPGAATSPAPWAQNPGDAVWAETCFIDFGSDPNTYRETLAARCRAIPGFVQFNADHGSGHNTCIFRPGAAAAGEPGPAGRDFGAAPTGPGSEFVIAGRAIAEAERGIASGQLSYHQVFEVINTKHVFYRDNGNNDGAYIARADAVDSKEACLLAISATYQMLSTGRTADAADVVKLVDQCPQDYAFGQQQRRKIAALRQGAGTAPEPGAPRPGGRQRTRVAIGEACMLVETTETTLGCGAGKHWWWTSIKAAKRPNCPSEFSFTDREPDAPGGASTGDAPTRLQTCGGPATEIKPYVEMR